MRKKVHFFVTVRKFSTILLENFDVIKLSFIRTGSFFENLIGENW